jgi:hypothetical protein
MQVTPRRPEGAKMEHDLKSSGLRVFVVAQVLLCILLAGAMQAQITVGDDPYAKLLNSWLAEGSAAGLQNITYENRDGGHSPFPATQWPQLKVYVPTPEEKEMKRDIGLAVTVRPFPLLGNSSMSAPPDHGGSLPRFYFTQGNGLGFLTHQYLDNNLFFYPCHLDHNPGWNGVRGWGDLYPINTSCTVISQGSSFTDQPFLQAFMAATAALPPETQSALIRSHMLIPTLQSLFRRSNKQVKNDADYFTGAAHPVVFRGDQIDQEKFIRMAHNLPVPAVPAVPLLEVLNEAPACVPGRDFFELPVVASESLANTACNIARVFRSSALKHELLVGAQHSTDLMRRTPTMKWVLLQGDPSRVSIEPTNDGLRAKITVAWHPEMLPPSGLATHRVDIGVFANNGFGWSAPAFITFYMLPNEARFYRPDGRLEEICYEAGNPDPGIPPSDDLRWLALGRKLASSPNAPASQLLLQVLPKEAVKALQTLADELEPRQRTWRALNDDPASKKQADTAMAVLREDAKKEIEAPLPGGTQTLREAVEKALFTVADMPDLFTQLQEPLASMARDGGKLEDFTAARKRAVDFRVLLQTNPHQYSLCAKPKDLTAGERAQLHSLNQTILATALLPEFLERSNQPAWVDPRLTLLKAWRDVYLYDKKGDCLGWTRITNGRCYEFDPIGRLLPDGRNGRAVEVKYERDESGTHLIFAAK